MSDGESAPIVVGIEKEETAETTAVVPGIFYVATNGNDSWSGQLAAPNSQGTDGPWRTIQRAANTLSPGETVYVRAGTYREGVWIPRERSGTENAPISYIAYPGEDVTLDGAVYPTAWQNHSGNIWWTDASQIDFNWEGEPRLIWQDDVWLQRSNGLGSMQAGTWWYDGGTQRIYVWLRENTNPSQHEIAVSSLRNAFHLNVASWITLDGFRMTHFYRAVSQMDSTPNQGQRMTGLTVRNTLIEHVGEGIGLAGATFGTWGFIDRALIENNVIRDTQSDAMWVGSGSGHVVRGNTISDVKQAWYRGFVSAALILGNADDSLIVDNEIFDVHALGIDVEHFYSGGYGNRNVIQGNRVYRVGQHAISILGANDTRIENNIIHDVEIFGILINTNAGPAIDNLIINNTLHNVSDRAVAIIEGQESGGAIPQGTRIQNNIFSQVGNWAIYDEGSGTSSDYNLYWQMQSAVAYWDGVTHFTLADFRGEGQEGSGLTGNPQFLQPGVNFRVGESSVAIDAGSNLEAPSLDHWGMARPLDGDGDSVAQVDVGAHEWAELTNRFFIPLLTLN